MIRSDALWNHAATNVFSDKTHACCYECLFGQDAMIPMIFRFDDSITNNAICRTMCYEFLLGKDAMVPMISVVVMYYFDSQTTNRSITMLL